jgi:hypothetical protein
VAQFKSARIILGLAKFTKTGLAWCVRLKNIFSREKPESPTCQSTSIGGSSASEQNRFSLPSPLSRPPANWLTWPVTRTRFTQRVVVVEPTESAPERHADIFNETLTYLLAPQPGLLDPLQPVRSFFPFEQFDLITFPEGFLPGEGLCAFLAAMSTFPPMGCIHVGLRPTSGGKSHMFSVAELTSLIDRIKKIAGIILADLDPFCQWLSNNSYRKELINLGCFFTKDADGATRVCLHPKNVRSRWEFSRREEAQMLEADLLSLVTLRPRDARLLSITIQPLLCSDMLILDRESPNDGPIHAITSEASCFGSSPPDHVDIVTVALCSPQAGVADAIDGPPSFWNQSYLDSFERSSREEPRHRYAMFVLANFSSFPGTTGPTGGLSGAYVPLPLRASDPFPESTTVFDFGRLKSSDAMGSNNNWEIVKAKRPRTARETLGHIVSISPVSQPSSVAATMFSFTLQRLPREANFWRGVQGITSCHLHSLLLDQPSGRYRFETRGDR